MPELPEVETIRRDLESLLLGHTMKAIHVHDRRLMSLKDEKRWQKVAPGAKWSRLSRKGKYLFVHLDNQFQLAFHLRMTGQLIVQDGAPQMKARLSIHFESGKTLGLFDQRRFAEAWLLAPGEDLRANNPLGPDALTELNVALFGELLKGRTTPVQTLLMDQRRVAGIGNIYAQEALFKAAIRPTRASRRISPVERQNLFDALKQTLDAAIAHRGSTSRNYRDALGSSGSAQTLHMVYQKAGRPCPKCESELRGIRVGGRGSVYCPKCQK